MQQNILRERHVTKIMLQYVFNGARKRHSINLRFMDKKECYFAAEYMPNFEKPKNKIEVELLVYTTDGVYRSIVKLLETNVSMREIMFTVSLPKTWNYTQMRGSSRKAVHLPVKIQYNDGHVINATTEDIALGGVCISYNEDISSIYRRIPCVLTLELPKNLIINLPESKLVTEAKFLREVSTEEDFRKYAFKFLTITYEQKNVLTNYLIKLE